MLLLKLKQLFKAKRNIETDDLIKLYVHCDENSQVILDTIKGALLIYSVSIKSADPNALTKTNNGIYETLLNFRDYETGWRLHHDNVVNSELVAITIKTKKSVSGIIQLIDLILKTGAKAVTINEPYPKKEGHWYSKPTPDEDNLRAEALTQAIVIARKTVNDMAEEKRAKSRSIDMSGYPQKWLTFLYAVSVLEQNMIQTSYERRGGAWRSGSCVVGNDMQRGLEHAMSRVAAYQYNHTLSHEENISQLVAQIKASVNTYPDNDAEGYVTGTIKQIAHDIHDL